MDRWWCVRLVSSLPEGTASVVCLILLGFSCRFFASSDLTVAEFNESKEESDNPENSDHAPSLAEGTRSTEWETETPPRRASPSAFSWSGSSLTEPSQPRSSPSDRLRTPSVSSGLSVLQQFHRKKENLSWGQTELPQRSTSPCSPAEGAADIKTPPASPPSQDSAYFSQTSSGHSTTDDSISVLQSTATSLETVGKHHPTAYSTLCVLLCSVQYTDCS